MRSLKHLFLLFFLVLSAGCGNTPIKSDLSENLDLTLDELNRYLEEAEELETDEKYKRKLLATELLIRKDEASRAHAVIQQVPLNYGESNFVLRHMLARAQISIREGEPYLAQRYLFHPLVTPEAIAAEPDVASRLLDAGATLLYDLSLIHISEPTRPY